jgi:protease-4
MKEFKFELTWEGVRGYLLWLVLPLIVGLLIAALVPQPVVGVIYLDQAIAADTAQSLNAQIDYARRHPEVRAVVLVLDSPGGTVADTEAVYLELLKLRQTKPVVASINSMAASGAYYLTVGTDYAFAKPTSDVGNIGVIGYMPSMPTIFEDVVSTGPYKLWGSPRDASIRQIEMVKQGFFDAVMAGRGKQLEAAKTPVDLILSGQIWPGSEALRLGLIDALGAQSDAEEKAAAMAHVMNYQVVDLSVPANIQPPAQAYGFFAQTADGVILPYPKQQGIYLLYIPPMPAQTKK